jgi:hypothetical protein
MQCGDTTQDGSGSTRKVDAGTGVDTRCEGEIDALGTHNLEGGLCAKNCDWICNGPVYDTGWGCDERESRERSAASCDSRSAIRLRAGSVDLVQRAGANVDAGTTLEGMCDACEEEGSEGEGCGATAACGDSETGV